MTKTNFVDNSASLKNNYTATTNPTSTDDSDAGYSVGSVWINTTEDERWVCLDATAGSAVWEKSTTGTASEIVNTPAGNISSTNVQDAINELDTEKGDMDNPMTTGGDIIYGGTSGTPTRLAKGTDGQVLTLASGVPSWTDASGVSSDFIILEDQKPDGTNGGTSSSGSWYDRVLNTEVVDTGNNCSLSSNQFTLTAGTYKIFATVPFNRASGGSIRLYNVSDSSTEVLGTLFSSDYGQGTIKGKFTITSSKTFKIQYWINNSHDNYGLGSGNWSDGEINVFTRVFLEKIA